MKCENCRFLCTEGYEYPETYCGAGVSEDDERTTDYGCSYHYKTLKKREREINEAMNKAYEVTDDDISMIFTKEEIV